MSKPTAEYLRECFREENGRLFWLKRPREHFKSEKGFHVFDAKYPDSEAGALSKITPANHRWSIKLDGKRYYRSRLIWCMHFNEWPDQIDHRDMNKLNDVVGNLRPCTDGQNKANVPRKATNTSGYKGVYLHKPTGLWRSKIQVGKKTISLGYFRDPVSAHQAYETAARKHYGEFART